MKDEKLYTIIEYGDKQAYVLNRNNNNPFKNRVAKYKPICRTKNVENPYMTIKQYVSTLNRKRKELYKFNIDSNKCLFLTLTTQSKFD